MWSLRVCKGEVEDAARLQMQMANDSADKTARHQPYEATTDVEIEL
jgi:hypothetical protein